jgi:hypothetical protein
MRINYRSIDDSKRLAKAVARETGLPLSKCQESVSTSSGYRNWFELANCVKPPSFPVKSTLTVDEEAQFVLRLSSALSASMIQISRAVSASGLFCEDDRLTRSLNLAPKLFRATSIPDIGKRQPGSVGKFKYDNEPVILRKFGQPTEVLFQRAFDSIMADFEYVTPRTPIPLFVPAALYVAYGAWTLADGSKVLHSRDYLPLWHVKQGNRPVAANPADWVDYVAYEYFWDDRSAPWESARRLSEERQRLVDFEITGLPNLVEILPDLIFSDRPRSIRGAAESRFGATSNRSHLESQA